MYNQRVIDSKQLPIPVKDRKYTDVICMCIHLALLLTLLAIAAVKYFTNTHTNLSPECSEGFSQFWNIQTNQIMCVNKCPQEYFLLDGVCYPSQQNELISLLGNSELSNKWSQSNLIKIMPIFLVFIFGVSFAILTISYLIPKIFQLLIVFIAFSILTFLILTKIQVVPPPHSLDLLLSTFPLLPQYINWAVIGLAIFSLLAWIACFYNQITWNGLLMDAASKILPQKMMFIILILKYYAKLLLVVLLFLFQHYAFTLSTSFLYSWTQAPSLTVLPILNIFLLIWNIQYMKDTRNYLLIQFTSPLPINSIHIIFRRMSSIGIILTLHLHIRAAGSFLNLIFFLPNCIFDIICCFPQEKRENCSLCCTSLTGLARNDAYAYMSLAAIPYCNSSRQCRRLANESLYFKGVNSPLSTFRLFLHIFTNAMCVSFGIILGRMHQIQITFWIFLILLLICQCLSSGLIDVLINFGQMLQTAILVDSSISDTKQAIYLNAHFIQGQLQSHLTQKTSLFQ